MSLRSLLTQRARLIRLVEEVVDGAPVGYDWTTVHESLPCRVDLSFQRRGMDPQWTPEAGRRMDRVGVGFFAPDAPVKPGDRLVMIKGPTGTFNIDGAWDAPVGRDGEAHHLEIGVTEVAQGQGS